MFFSGDPTIKKKVDLGGRSTRERDRQKLLEQTKLEREQRHRFRVQSQSATRIQVWIFPLFHFAAEAPPPCPSPANPRVGLRVTTTNASCASWIVLNPTTSRLSQAKYHNDLSVTNFSRSGTASKLRV
jgi:hypothetical protein